MWKMETLFPILFGMKTIRSACSILEKDVIKDAHLMVTNPEEYIPVLADIGFDAVAFHWESVKYPMRLIEQIHQLGMKAGIGLNPKTSAEEIDSYLQQTDYVLLLSAEPDLAGEYFQRRILDKIVHIREKNRTVEIIVDGGVNEQNIGEISQTGADGVVLGRAIFQTDDVENLVESFRMKGA